MSSAANANGYASNIDKIKRYGWTVRNSPGKMMLIPKHELEVDSEYQRTPVIGKVQAIASDFSWIGFGVLLVAKRNSRYWIIDGQHRHKAAMARNDIDEVPCLVFETSDKSQEAAGFVDCNTARKAVTAAAKHRARVVAKNELALRIQSEFEKYGLEPMDGGHSLKRINCVHACYKIASRDFMGFKAVLSVASEICEKDKIQIYDKVLYGLFYIHRNYDGGILESRINNRIRYIGGEELSKAAGRGAAVLGKGGERQYAFGMLQAINKSLKTKYTVRGIETI